MVNPCPEIQRKSTWLSLAVAVLLALFPVGGVTMCFGSDGHFGIGGGAAGHGVASHACPCEHAPPSSSLRAEASVEDLAPLSESDPHPACVDFALDPPEVFRDGGNPVDLPQVRIQPDDAWALGCAAPLCYEVPPRSLRRGAVTRGSPPDSGGLLLAHLRRQRCIILLI